MIIGNVIQFGTLSLRPSMTAATTSVMVTNQTGQFSVSEREMSCKVEHVLTQSNVAMVVPPRCHVAETRSCRSARGT